MVNTGRNAQKRETYIKRKANLILGRWRMDDQGGVETEENYYMKTGRQDGAGETILRCTTDHRRGKEPMEHLLRETFLHIQLRNKETALS